MVAAAAISAIVLLSAAAFSVLGLDLYFLNKKSKEMSEKGEYDNTHLMYPIGSMRAPIYWMPPSE